jgi:GNAT superfamily N-acetyltransferase
MNGLFYGFELLAILAMLIASFAGSHLFFWSLEHYVAFVDRRAPRPAPGCADAPPSESDPPHHLSATAGAARSPATAAPLVRPATEADAASIAALATQLGYQVDTATMSTRLRKIVPHPDHLVIVADTADEGVCGWLQVQARDALESGFRVEIAGLIVADTARRRGVGRLLVARAEEWARDRGADTIVVRSNVARAESHAFYPALGYVTAKTQTVYRKKLSE